MASRIGLRLRPKSVSVYSTRGGTSGYENENLVRQMLKAQGYVIGGDNRLTVPKGVTPNMAIPSELIPHCPVCGRPMTMNLRCDDTFVEDEGWHRAAERYSKLLPHPRGTEDPLSGIRRRFQHPGHYQIPLLADDGKESQSGLRLRQSGAGILPGRDRQTGDRAGCQFCRDSFPVHRVNGALSERRQTSAPGSLHTQKHLCLHFADRGVFYRIQVFHVGLSVPQASRLRGRSGICGHFSVTTVTPFSPSP